ncbi:hypothetical protein WJX72_009014 [[Myrmecia] bisecta]|uniref:mannan endo-1,4-beta-mannosidase n=1 Tax=[Myrmecia] bisecta TaxID=41462 RepID=A0AAW1Q6W6_9CHLO
MQVTPAPPSFPPSVIFSKANQSVLATYNKAPWGTASAESLPAIPDFWTRDQSASLDKGRATAEEWPFVYVSGTKLMLSGRNHYFGGTNAVDLIDTCKFTNDQIRQAFQIHAKNGVRVVRIFAFINGFGQPGGASWKCRPIQPYIGRYDEYALKRVDLLLAEAGKNGIKLVLALSNFNADLGGWQWYVDNILGGGDMEWFLTNALVKQAYKNYLTMLIWRTNTITGIQYRSDPTILAWECANEPHTSDNYEKSRGWTPGHLVYNWLSEMSAFIRSQDPNHLIATGEEGYRTEGPTDCCHNSWINSGLKGGDFLKNCGLHNISFCTIHAYTDSWGIAASEASWLNANIIVDRAKIAHGLGKPIVLEEYGMKNGYMPCRDTLFHSMQDAANGAGYAGSLVWQVYANHIDDKYGSFDFSYGECGTNAVTAQNWYLRGL